MINESRLNVLRRPYSLALQTNAVQRSHSHSPPGSVVNNGTVTFVGDT